MTQKTFNTGYSLVVTDPTTNPALTGLSAEESGRDPEFSSGYGRMYCERVEGLVLYPGRETKDLEKCIRSPACSHVNHKRVKQPGL